MAPPRQAQRRPSGGARPARPHLEPNGGPTAERTTPPSWPRTNDNAGARILVVDDDDAVRVLISRYLALEGFDAEECGDAESMLEAIRRRRPDLVLLDVMLPGRDGLDLLGQLRREGDLPVILVTAKGEEADRVMGLRLGADDYIVKPFSPTELVARIAAVLRRQRATGGRTLEFDGLTLDLATRRLFVRGELVRATTKELDLLAFLAASPSTVFTRDELLANVWGSSSKWQDPDTVTEHVHRIRHLIEDDPSHPVRIRTVRGVGYSFEP